MHAILPDIEKGLWCFAALDYIFPFNLCIPYIPATPFLSIFFTFLSVAMHCFVNHIVRCKVATEILACRETRIYELNCMQVYSQCSKICTP